MKYELDDKIYNVIIKKKGNKNTYIRVDENNNIIVTTNYFITNNYSLISTFTPAAKSNFIKASTALAEGL